MCCICRCCIFIFAAGQLLASHSVLVDHSFNRLADTLMTALVFLFLPLKDTMLYAINLVLHSVGAWDCLSLLLYWPSKPYFSDLLQVASRVQRFWFQARQAHATHRQVG